MKKSVNATADYIVIDTTDVKVFLTDEQKQQLVEICNTIGQQREVAGKESLRGIFLDEQSDLFEYVYCYMVGKQVISQRQKIKKTKGSKTDNQEPVVSKQEPVVSKQEPVAKPQYTSPFRKTKQEK